MLRRAMSGQIKRSEGAVEQVAAEMANGAAPRDLSGHIHIECAVSGGTEAAGEINAVGQNGFFIWAEFKSPNQAAFSRGECGRIISARILSAENFYAHTLDALSSKHFNPGCQLRQVRRIGDQEDLHIEAGILQLQNPPDERLNSAAFGLQFGDVCGSVNGIDSFWINGLNKPVNRLAQIGVDGYLVALLQLHQKRNEIWIEKRFSAGHMNPPPASGFFKGGGNELSRMLPAVGVLFKLALVHAGTETVGTAEITATVKTPQHMKEPGMIEMAVHNIPGG